ncbi:microtubule-destabilizing protein 60 isoform X1 [Populus nigra]|uniref:microtubule-destabilizing protein 60 isoform X1 n=1 Tax=Populus nigra TaxID=3691 RepID=UPI002B2657AE|nr:microtubule-destabilizing protein 60 isoform X1 [Populus nigra]
MEKAHTKSALKKLVKASSQSAPWSNAARGMAKDDLKDPLYDKSKVAPKPFAKENTKPQEFKLHTGQRALKRAMFNYSVATKIYMNEQQKRQIERIQKIIEEEEVRTMRKEMVPRAQLMPYFDRPFFPQRLKPLARALWDIKQVDLFLWCRSSRPLTVPREPSFHMVNSKCWSCIPEDELYYYFEHAHPHDHAWKPVK